VATVGVKGLPNCFLIITAGHAYSLRGGSHTGCRSPSSREASISRHSELSWGPVEWRMMANGLGEVAIPRLAIILLVQWPNTFYRHCEQRRSYSPYRWGSPERKQRWQLLTDTDGVGVWPNVSSWVRDINQGQGLAHTYTHEQYYSMDWRQKWSTLAYSYTDTVWKYSYKQVVAQL